jgi:glycosyltransferase involved in cell wall biosynthesis
VSGVLLCGDLGSDRCGVGASEAAALEAVTPRPATADPRRPVAALRAVLRARGPVVVAYPTRSTVSSLRATATLALAAVLARGRLRWHLHEYAVFDGRRALLDLLLVVGGGRVVVSTETEADTVRRSRGGRIAHRVSVRVLPPANGTAPRPAGDEPAPPAEPPVVGLFGRARADKGLDVAVTALRSLPGDGGIRVETVGEGWDEAPWPAGTPEIAHHGRVPTADLAPLISRWTLAIAPFADGATDGRMSLRTPLACGVPTLTTVTRPSDLTLRPPHLLLDPTVALAAAGTADRAAGAAAVARFEADTVARLAAELWS